mmetsp:Transcript_15251/g.25346  ORF Transcript_15251/g.25346 Transcript_15251/m.25346 type:complete len:214 (+) Transcript_15251:51-692(+)
MSTVPSDTSEVCKMYASSASDYAQMMNDEINLPVYTATFTRLKSNIEGVEGSIIDTACGSGDMLAMYRTQYCPDRVLLGFDLSPEMVKFAQKKLGDSAQVDTGDMRVLSKVESDTAAAVINFYAIHHICEEDLKVALCEWHRVLKQGGQLLLAAWEGEGAIDYGEHADIVAIKYSQDQLSVLLQAAGFSVTRSVVELVEDLGLNGVYVDAVKL